MFMSKNKIIKFMHDETGLSYKECRKRLKENKWDLVKAMGYGEDFEKIISLISEFSKGLASAANAMVDATKKIAQSFADTINSIDWSAIRQAATRSERIGEFWGAPAYTEYLVCPDCHSDEIEEYIPNEEEGEEE